MNLLNGNSSVRPDEVVVLAGGLGTRLRPVIADRPKSLAPIRGQPYLDYLLNWLEHQEFKSVIFAIGYMGEQVIQYAQAKQERTSLLLRTSNETSPLGTGGAIKRASSLVQGESFLVVNGDTFLDYDFTEFWRFHSREPTKLSLCAARVEDLSRYGALQMGEGDRVLGFREKSSLHKGPGLINGGHYLLQKEIWNLIDAKCFSFENEILAPYAQTLNVRAFTDTRHFIDIGTPEGLAMAELTLTSPR